ARRRARSCSADIRARLFLCTFITQESALSGHRNQRPSTERASVSSAASPSAERRPPAGDATRSVHDSKTVTRPSEPLSQARTTWPPRRRENSTSTRCPRSGWNGCVMTTKAERSLEDPALCRFRGYPQLAELPRAAGLGDLAFPHRQWPERARFELGTQVVQEPGHAHGFPDPGGGHAVCAGGVRALVARDPGKRHDQRRRVMHEAVQVIEPAARIGRRPTVKLGLHPRYPRPRPSALARSAAIRRCVLRHCSLLPSSAPLPPFPM